MQGQNEAIFMYLFIVLRTLMGCLLGKVPGVTVRKGSAHSGFGELEKFCDGLGVELYPEAPVVF